MCKIYIETSRLILRDWKEGDFPEFVRMNKDEKVMEFFLKKLTEEETQEFLDRILTEFKTCGYGLFAVERKDTGVFIGYVGFHHITFDVDFAPGVEIGWRLLPETWGVGFASEAATACLKYAGEVLGLKEIYSFTSELNKRSERVMQRIGMEWIKEFDHPLVEANHPLQKHVLYKYTLSN